MILTVYVLLNMAFLSVSTALMTSKPLRNSSTGWSECIQNTLDREARRDELTGCSQRPQLSSSTEFFSRVDACLWDAVGSSPRRPSATLSSESVPHSNTHPVFQVALIQTQLSDFR